MMDLLVMVQIDGRQCALRARDVQSVMEIEAVTPIPCSPSHVLGLSTRRSQTLTVIDCRAALGLASHSDPIGQRAAVVKHDEHYYALLVDVIDDVEDALDEIQAISAAFGTEWARVSYGRVETALGVTLLLDVSKLVQGPEETTLAA